MAWLRRRRRAGGSSDPGQSTDERAGQGGDGPPQGLRGHARRRRDVRRAAHDRDAADHRADRDAAGSGPGGGSPTSGPPSAWPRSSASRSTTSSSPATRPGCGSGTPARLRRPAGLSTDPPGRPAQPAATRSSASATSVRTATPGAALGRVAVRRLAVERRAGDVQVGPRDLVLAALLVPTNSLRKSPATSMPPIRSPMLAMSATCESMLARSSGGQRHRPELLAGALGGVGRSARGGASSLLMTAETRVPERDDLVRRSASRRRRSGPGAPRWRATSPSARTSRPSASVLSTSTVRAAVRRQHVGGALGRAGGHVLGHGTASR